MSNLFPPIEPYQTHQLAVDEIHSIYVEESGNPDGIAVVFIHGGPGGGCSADSRRFFNPQYYRIITFDQRGCGRSTPHASLENNTTWHLVEDIEKIRQLLQIDQWLVFGGSWGSTLALAYSEQHPKPVLGLILRGIYLCRPREIQWYYQYGASNLFPEYWQDFVEPIAQQNRDDLVAAYYRILTNDNEPQTQLKAALQWYLWEMRTSQLLPAHPAVNTVEKQQKALAFSRIECHYFYHNSFFTDNQLLANANKIAHIPCVIVHGRYDMPCPVDNAWSLHKALPNSELHIIEDAGHSAMEPKITAQLINATNKFVQRLK